MIRTPVASSNIASVGYDPQHRLLTIQFKNDRVYQYDGVEGAVYDALLSAESAGKFFFAEIRGKFAEREVTEPVPSVIQGDRPEGNES